MPCNPLDDAPRTRPVTAWLRMDGPQAGQGSFNHIEEGHSDASAPADTHHRGWERGKWSKRWGQLVSQGPGRPERLELAAPTGEAEQNLELDLRLMAPGECARLIRESDWSATPLGPISGWPQSLKSTLGMALRSRQPMVLFWGEELIQFYNDAFLPTFGEGAHPGAMGQRASECWQAGWAITGPRVLAALRAGEGSLAQDQMVPIFRNGRLEDAYWTYTVSPVFGDEGGVMGALSICTETTKRVLSERDELLLQAPVATALLIGPSHVFQLANELYCQIAGVEALVGKSLIEAFPQMRESGLLDIYDRVYQTGVAYVSEEHTLLEPARSGSDPTRARYFKFNLQPLRDAGGKVYGMMSLLIDTTEQISARQIIARSSDERDQLLAELEAASRTKDEFLAMLGHELRNPLAPIVNSLQLMRIRKDSSTAKEQAIIQRQVEHLTRLVDDLLDVSRIARGKIELRRESVDVSEVIRKAVELASFALEQGNHNLSLEMPTPPISWHGDATRLAQVVANLLTNAARYTPSGGHIRLRAERDGNQLSIRVRDNGIGIAPEILPRVFEMFYQGKRGLDRAEGGLGLGLALVRSLVAMHGGSVMAHSEGKGRGSEFHILLPIEEQQRPGAPRQAQAAPASVGTASDCPLRVLIVDDNSDAADSLAELLRIYGHEVVVAIEPMMALDMVEHLPVDIAVLDIGLPGMDGYELAGHMRAKLGPDRCKLIALTGYGQEHDRIRSAEAGFEAHLVKPVDFTELTEIIDKLGERLRRPAPQPPPAPAPAL